LTTGLNWMSADWPAPAGIVAGSTFRTGGCSSGRYSSLNLGAHVGDDPDAVRANRQQFTAECGLPSTPQWLTQVHGAEVAIEPAPLAVADASLTRRSGVVLAIMTADCLPVLFSADDGSEIAAAHAGWRGLAAGVLENTVSAFKAPASKIVAWLGPAISQTAFEVGSEVRHQFVAQDPGAVRFFASNDRNRWQADLYGLARQRLAAAGVTRIEGGKYCTYADAARFFSYRRDGECGRMATFIFRDD